MKKTYSANLENLDAISEDVELFCEENNVDLLAFAINLCIDEIFTNIVTYGYKEDPLKSVDINVDIVDGTIVTEIIDTAPAFNPLCDPEQPDTTCSLEDREIGGLGIFFVHKNMDDVKYESKNGVNILTMVKKI